MNVEKIARGARAHVPRIGATRRAGPRASGGQRIDVLLSPRLSGALTELVSVLRNQNEVVSARPASLIPPEEISVRVRQDDLTVRGTPTKRTED